MSRESLPALPYSVEEIYGIRTSGKYGTLKQIYHEFYRIYNLDETKGEIEPEALLQKTVIRDISFLTQCAEKTV